MNLPFSFKFYGQSYQSVTVSLYGYLTFSGVGTQGVNQGIPHNNNTYPANLIAPWWDTLVRVSGVTFVRVQTLGTEPNRRFVVEWKEMGLVSTTGPRASFQVTLFEGTQQIRISYAPFTMPASPVGTASSRDHGAAGRRAGAAAHLHQRDGGQLHHGQLPRPVHHGPGD